MFKREVKSLDELLNRFLREEGLETPLLQQRVVNAWEQVAGPMVARYTTEKFVKNQMLFVKITNPALRQDLSMMRAQFVKRLNAAVGSSVVTDVRVVLRGLLVGWFVGGLVVG
jgi:predicted nucleic acid-binding Zn ribbon protein